MVTEIPGDRVFNPEVHDDDLPWADEPKELELPDEPDDPTTHGEDDDPVIS